MPTATPIASDKPIVTVLLMVSSPRTTSKADLRAFYAIFAGVADWGKILYRKPFRSNAKSGQRKKFGPSQDEVQIIL